MGSEEFRAFERDEHRACGKGMMTGSCTKVASRVMIDRLATLLSKPKSCQNRQLRQSVNYIIVSCHLLPHLYARLSPASPVANTSCNLSAPGAPSVSETLSRELLSTEDTRVPAAKTAMSSDS